MFTRCLAMAFGMLICIWLQALPANARSELTDRFDALAEAFTATEAVPGAIGALVVGDEVILRGWDYADLDTGRRAGPDDVRFEIDSISRLFTWLAVMMLVEEGALDLQADVAGYLVDTLVPGDDPLTLADLMNHRPGLEDSYALFDRVIGALPRPAALAASAPARVFPRGAVMACANRGMALAGQIAEDVAGIPCVDFLQRRILDPPGMGATTCSEVNARPDSRRFRAATGFRPGRIVPMSVVPIRRA